VLDLTTTALQRPVPPQEVRVRAGARFTMERKREEGVWSELRVHGGCKGEGVPGGRVGREPMGTGGGSVQAVEASAIGSFTSLMWAAW